METSSADKVPVCLVRKILCYLSYPEASRMRILSKTWLQAWSDLPNLEFGVNSGKSITIVDEITKRYKDENIPIEKFHFHNFTKPDHIFPLIDRWLDIALQNGVRDVVYRDVRHSTSYPFPVFKFLESKYLRELILTGCDLMHVSLFSVSHVATCHSLRKLSLSCVRINMIMLQILLYCCPFIVDLTIEHCTGLKNIELWNLRYIRSLTIRIHQPIIIHAPALEHLSYSSYSLKYLNIVEYENLKSLEISCTDISDRYLNHLISVPYCLESLLVTDNSIEKFDICRHESLRVLKIRNSKIIGSIDAPNLVSFEYKGCVIPQLKFVQNSGQLKHSQIILDPLYNLDAAWFFKLRKFLSDSISWSQVTLCFLKCNEIDLKDFQLHCRDATPKIDVLDVKFLAPTCECSRFVDALLWSCRPRKINLQSTSGMFACFIDRLMHMKNLSHKHGILREAKVYQFDQKSQSWQHKRGELSIRTTSKSEKYFFLLDW